MGITLALMEHYKMIGKGVASSEVNRFVLSSLLNHYGHQMTILEAINDGNNYYSILFESELLDPGYQGVVNVCFENDKLYFKPERDV